MILNNDRLRKAIYFVAPTYLNSLVSLLTFPLVANSLGVKSFGQLDLLLMMGTILSLGLHFGWVGAHNRYYLEPDINRSDLVRTLLLVRAGIFTLLVVLIFSLKKILFYYLGIDAGDEVLLWIVVGIFASTELLQFYLQRYRMLNQARNYMMLVLTKTLTYPALLVSSISFFPASPLFVLLSLLGSVVIPLSFAWLFDNKWLLVGRFDSDIFIRTLHFGAPLVLASLAVLGLQVIDRGMLRALVIDPEWSLTLIGFYAFASRLVSVKVLAVGGFSVLWAPYVWRTYRTHDVQSKYKYIFSTYLFFLMLLGLAAIVLSLALVPVFMPDFSAALPIFSILLSASMLYSIGDYFCVGVDIKEKTWVRSLSGVISLVVNVILNALLIPSYEAIGAAFATLVATCCYVLILLIASHRLYPVSYPYFLLTLVVVFIAFTSTLYQSSLILTILVITIFVLMVFLFLRKDIMGALLLIFGKEQLTKPSR